MIPANIDAIETDRHPKAAKFTPFETLVKLKEKHPNISAKNLGKLVGISPQAVCQMFARHGIDFRTGIVTAVEEYKVNRADILAVKQIECLNAIDHRKLKKASVRDLTIAFGTMYDKERLERGLSTSNAAVVYASAVEWAFKDASHGDSVPCSMDIQGIEQTAQPVDITPVGDAGE